MVATGIAGRIVDGTSLDRKHRPSRFIAARPWLARRQLHKPPERLYRAKVRTQKLMIGQLLFLPMQVLTGKLLMVPLLLMGVVGGARTHRELKRDPEAFYIKDALTRQLLAQYDEEIDAHGVWSVAPSLATIFGLPVALAAMAVTNGMMMGQGSPLTLLAVGLLVGTALSILDVVIYRYPTFQSRPSSVAR